MVVFVFLDNSLKVSVKCFIALLWLYSTGVVSSHNEFNSLGLEEAESFASGCICMSSGVCALAAF